MEGMGLIYEALPDLSGPSSEFKREYAACLSTRFFVPVLANLDEFRRGGELRTDVAAPVKTMYCLLRCSLAIPEERVEELRHALKRRGFILAALDQFCAVTGDWDRNEVKAPMPDRVRPYDPYVTRAGERRWSPGELTPESILPAVLKRADGSILRDAYGMPRIVRGRLSGRDAGRLIEEGLADMAGVLAPSRYREPVWFEKCIDIDRVGGIPVEWRAYFHHGKPFYLCPKRRLPDGLEVPEPPESALGAPEDLFQLFHAVDYARASDGAWWAITLLDGQYAPLPDGANPAEFLEKLEEVTGRGCDHPSWSWCVTGTIVPSHIMSGSKATVSGSKHFAPETKVYVINAHFGSGAGRCKVVGIPKYADRYVCIDMETDLIENFAVERVEEETILRAIYTGRLYEDFTRDREFIRSCWGNAPDDFDAAKGFAKSLNEFYGSGGPRERCDGSGE